MTKVSYADAQKTLQRNEIRLNRLDEVRVVFLNGLLQAGQNASFFDQDVGANAGKVLRISSRCFLSSAFAALISTGQVAA